MWHESICYIEEKLAKSGGFAQARPAICSVLLVCPLVATRSCFRPMSYVARAVPERHD